MNVLWDSGKTLRSLVLLVGSASALVLGGCSTVPQAQYDEAIAENNELRDRVVALQDTVAQGEDDKAVLREQNAQLDAELARVQGELARAPEATAPARGGSGLRPTDVVLTIAGDVLFASGQVTLKPEGRRELDDVARLILSQYPSNLIRVEGYTDTDPIRRSKWQTNERLSAERALSVEAYLVQRGVDADQIYAAALGPANPKSSKQASRRVEIVILASN